MVWFEAEVEEGDLANLFLIGSPDLQETFGSYRIIDINREMSACDPHNHRARVRSLIQGIHSGFPLERPIVVSESVSGPFVVIDGNHRCLAHHCLERLPGLQVYLGMAPGLLGSYRWAWPALEPASTTADDTGELGDT